MTRVAPASTLLLALVLAPLAPAFAQGAGEPHLTDPTGDATWLTTQDAQTSARFACWAAGPVTATACGAAPAVPEAGGAPAPPALDLVHVSFAADGEMLHVELALASLDHDFDAAPAGDEIMGYGVCWRVGETLCRDGVGFSVVRVNGVLAFDPYVYTYGERCGGGGCWFGIAHEIVPGTPGSIRFHVPRATLDASLGAIEDAQATVVHVAIPAGGGFPEYALRARDANVAGWTGAWAFSLTDEAVGGKPYVLPAPARVFSPEADTRVTRADPAGDVPAADRPDLDLLNVSFLEDERALTVALQVARVEDVPTDHHLFVSLTATTGASLVAGYTATGGARAPYSGVCGSTCGPNPATPLKKPAELDVVAGEPGWINLTIARSDLGRPGHGDTLSYVYIGMLLPEAVRQQGTPDARVQVVDAVRGDFMWEVPPWWFRLGPPRELKHEGSAFYLEDPVGDIDTSEPLLTALGATTSLAPFDITSLRIDPLPHGELRIELGVRDLSRVSPPTGFQAVLYAAAIATDQGSFMVGYYDDRDRREFFCAPDTAVLSKPARDPNEVIWQSIQGLLSVARDRGQGASGGSAPGSLIFLAPYSCLLEEAGRDIRAEAIAAGTFLLQGTAEEGISVQAVDGIASEGEVVLSAAQLAPPPWYAEPFGIDNFWDITGIVSAIVVALFGALALRRKQGALRRYLHEIEHVLRLHAGDARARERALLDIQDRVKRDLLKNRITESHFVIVERRLDQHLSKVRVQALADVFGDIPHRLLVTLQDLLRDGAMDREDWQLFRTQLAAEPHLGPDARAGIERRVEAWVREHRA